MTRSRVLLFGVIIGVMASGYGVMFTVLDDFREEYGIEPQWLGLIIGVGFLTSFVAQIFLAPIADRGRARRLVLFGLLLNVVGLLAMAVGTTLIVLLAGRVVSGLGVGMAFPAVRRIVVNADPEHLGTNLGLLLSADVAGFALGPVVSAVLVPRFGIPAPFLVIAALSMLAVPIVLRIGIAETSPSDVPAARFAFDLLRNRSMVAGVMMGSGLFLMIGTFDALWVLVLDDLDASEFLANSGITIFALPLIFLGAYGGRLAQKVGPFRLGPLGLLLGAVYMALYGVLPTALAMLGVGTIHAISDGLTASSTAVAVGLVAPPDRQAGAQGMLGAAETLTGGVTAIAAGVLYSVGGRGLAYGVTAMMMIGLAVGSYLVADPADRRRPAPEADVPEPNVVPHA